MTDDYRFFDFLGLDEVLDKLGVLGNIGVAGKMRGVAETGEIEDEVAILGGKLSG